MVKDPICGMMVNPEKAEFTSKKDGVVYYFCSIACKGKFDRMPSQSERKKGWFTRFLEGLAKANEERFGKTPPSCCGGAKQ